MGSLPEELTLELLRLVRALCTTNNTWNGDMSAREAQSILAKCTAHQENTLQEKEDLAASQMEARVRADAEAAKAANVAAADAMLKAVAE